jgi:hypothetical protein
MKKIAIVLGMGCMLTFGSAALAHTDHDETDVMLDAKKTDGGASLLVSKNGNPIATAGAKGTLTLVGGSGKQVVQLRPAGTNAMETKTMTKIAPGSKAKASITFADKTTANVDVVIN